MLDQLAALVGEPIERLRQWRNAGLLDAVTERFAPKDVEWIRMIQLALRRGISLDRLARAQNDESSFLRRYLELFFPAGDGSTHTWSEAANMFGLEREIARRVLGASGLTELADTLDDRDIEMLQAIRVALDAGMPEEALLQIVRVSADALDRVAENEVRLFHYYVHERLKATGLSGLELLEATLAASDRLLPLIEPSLLFFHRKSLLRANREDLLLHLEEDTSDLDTDGAPAQMRAAIVFVDLSSFTPLTETMGDATAVEILTRFSLIVREAATQSEGRVVKQIGDAFMLVFPEPRFALSCAFEIERRASREPLFPALRTGIQWGQVLYREGDYVGTNVNIASRLASEARPHEVLVTGGVRERARGAAIFEPAGGRKLKGIAEELELFRARAIGVEPSAKELDPVCGMELAPQEVAARLSIGDHQDDLAFCSDDCLRRFVASPEAHARVTSRTD